MKFLDWNKSIPQDKTWRKVFDELLTLDIHLVFWLKKSYLHELPVQRAICTICHKTRQTTTFIYKYFICFSFTVPIPTLPPPPRDFPRPDIIVNCLADGVSVSVKVADPNFHGVMYVKGHAQSTECRRNVEQGEAAEPLDFSVKFDTCGLFHSDVSYLLAHIAIQTLYLYCTIEWIKTWRKGLVLA